MTRLILCRLLMVTLMILTSCTGTGEGASSRTSKTLRDGKQITELVNVDVKKNLETYIVRQPPSARNVTLVVMYDFNKVLMMMKDVRGSRCLLQASTDGALRPTALKKELDQLKNNSKIKVVSKTEEVIKEVGKISQRMYRKVLGREMKSLCKGLPIVWVTSGELKDIEGVNQFDEIQKQTTSKRRLKRSCRCQVSKYCWTTVSRKCNFWGCKNHHHRHCRDKWDTVCNK